MKIQLSKIKRNPDNPRVIKDDKYQKLKESIQAFPEMLALVPLVLDEKNTCLSGNQRLAVLKELGYIEIDYIRAKDLTPEQKREFVVKANHHYGEWDGEALAKTWDTIQLKDWGLDFSFEKDSTTVSFSAAKRKKGTQVRVQCASEQEAGALFEELLKRGMNVEIK